MSDARDDALAEATGRARDAAWSTYGALDADVLAHLINPTFMGGPRWPALRQAFRVARGPLGTLVASDGLADPFDDVAEHTVNGLELEVYALGPVGDVPVQRSWLFQLVWSAAQLCADNGGVAGLLDELGVISTELYDVDIPAPHRARFVTPEGRVGVLIGGACSNVPSRISGPLSPIRLVNLTLLTLEELAFVVARGARGREMLAEALGARPDAGVSSLTRGSVISLEG